MIPGSGRSFGIGNGKPLQYSSLENSKDRGAWQATVHVVTQSDKTESLTHTQPDTELLIAVSSGAKETLGANIFMTIKFYVIFI